VDGRHEGGKDPFIGALEGQKGHYTLGRVGALRRRGRAWCARVERAASSARCSCNGRHEGHARGEEGFVRASVSGAELDREGLGRWPRGAHGHARA
jgi:hypothetical protein